MGLSYLKHKALDLLVLIQLEHSDKYPSIFSQELGFSTTDFGTDTMRFDF